MLKVRRFGGEEIAEAIQKFVAGAREPVLLEPGAEVVEVEPARMAIDAGVEWVRLSVWDEGSSLRRRVTGVRECGPGRLELAIEKFGGVVAKAMLVDRARPLMHGLARDSRRFVFADQMRRFLTRQFSGWRIEECTTHADLEHSLSPSYARAMVKRGGVAWAAIGAPSAEHADGALTYGLIWHDYLRRRERRLLIEGLAVFVPEGRENTVCLRARCLRLGVAVFRYDAEGWEESVELSSGNLKTKLEAASAAPTTVRWAEQGREWWLEQTVRLAPQKLDARLVERPIYGQVPAVAGVERGIIDLLGCEQDGRLSVLELKASADPHLPMQALDYWIRVRWHAERRDFGGKGYFPGMELREDAPRLLLVAPSLEFHPTTETLLGYFDPAIEVERIGLAVEWGREVRVSFRLPGARRPC